MVLLRISGGDYDRCEGARRGSQCRDHGLGHRLGADEAFAASEYDGFFGRTTVADSMARFYGFDLLVHGWDLARALGRETAWSDAEMDRIDSALDGFGDNLYHEGVCAPALDVADDAPRQTRLLARMGRAA